MIYWFTGQPGHGKTTLALALIAQLKRLGYSPHHIDGDDLRDMTGNKDYSEAGRISNVKDAQSIARFLHHNGEVVVVSLIAPYRDMREELKSSIEMSEIFVHTDEERGREKNHVVNYEQPLENFIDLDTGQNSIDECVETILDISPVPSKELKTLDNHNFNAFISRPDSKPKGGLVVIQEIFGVNEHIREVCRKFMKEGYLTIAASLFDREGKNIELDYTKNDISKGRILKEKYNLLSLNEIKSSVEYVKSAGKVGVVGY